jgi:hypothetical protein
VLVEHVCELGPRISWMRGLCLSFSLSLSNRHFLQLVLIFRLKTVRLIVPIVLHCPPLTFSQTILFLSLYPSPYSCEGDVSAQALCAACVMDRWSRLKLQIMLFSCCRRQQGSLLSVLPQETAPSLSSPYLRASPVIHIRPCYAHKWSGAYTDRQADMQTDKQTGEEDI